MERLVHVTCSLNMQSASGCIQLENTAKEAEGARRGITRRSSTVGSMFGDASMQLSKPEEQACTHGEHQGKRRLSSGKAGTSMCTTSAQVLRFVSRNKDTPV